MHARIITIPLSLFILALLAGCPPSDANADGDCLTDAEEVDLGTDPESVDSDSDGLDDCAEVELGTDPTSEDSDGDGALDAEEIDCVSDPLDPDEQCYACGWGHNDPGGLESEGNDEGDTVANVDLVDQCDEEVPMWDLAGEYRYVFITAAWCGACRSELNDVMDDVEEFRDETGAAFDLLVVLFEDYTGSLPDSSDAENYHGQIGDPDFPVTSSEDASILDASGYAGAPLPGKMLLSPDMEILGNAVGHGGDAWIYDTIRDIEGL
jgi:hypothetical protein